jgi:hypothetical protein
MNRPGGYYWVKFPGDEQQQIVLIQEDGVIWIFGKSCGQYVAGEEPEVFRGQGISLEVISGPLEPPSIPAAATNDSIR